MYSHIKFDGDAKSTVSLQVATASSNVVFGKRTCVDIIFTVIIPSRRIDAFRHAIPLGGIASSFQTSWQVAADGKIHRGVATHNVSCATTQTNGICRHDTFVVAQIVEDDAIVFALALREVECAEIYPSAATHLLIDAEMSLDATMLNRVVGIRNAVRQSLIGDIDGIIAFEKYLGHPYSFAQHVLVLYGFGHAELSHLEGILAILITFFDMGKAYASIFPMTFSDALLVTALVEHAIVVDYDFLPLPVAFSWCEDNGSGILEHRDEVGNDKGLCEHVFRSAEESWTLPNPFLLVETEVLAMTLTYTEMTALQAFLDVVGAAHRRHPGIAFE